MEALGKLVERMVTYWTNHEPETSLKWLKEGSLADNLIRIAVADLNLVFGMGGVFEFMWSDMMSSGQLGVFPPETESADKETRNQVCELLRKQGPSLVDDALWRTNLGRDWTPQHPTEYQE